ncbi:DUF1659 domain-containing protein [Clostridium estertheticum]|uniref:DUF1659 domain-containing protein n=1 Tax=Clostridium estertheticum TaxID=238834 RepID=UPI0034E491F3
MPYNFRYSLPIPLNGKDEFATKSLGNVKVNTVDADIFAVGQAISKIKTYPLIGIDRQDQYSLITE